MSAALANVQTMRNQAQQTAYETQIERYKNPRLVDLWAGFLDLGYAATKGNAETQTFTLSARADRATTRDKIGVYYTSIFSSNDTSGTNQTTANSKRGGVVYDVNLNKKLFAWGSVDLESDQFQQLDLRFVPGGRCWSSQHQNGRDHARLPLGVSYNREFFSTGLRRNSAEILLGRTSLTTSQRPPPCSSTCAFSRTFPTGEAVRMNFDTTFAVALKKWLSLQATFSDRYLSNPSGPGRKTNDILYSTGVRVSFAP
ncbi:MAG: DUF481 domain-containing protein [Acidobacteriota bacterium]